MPTPKPVAPLQATKTVMGGEFGRKGRARGLEDLRPPQLRVLPGGASAEP